MARKLPTAGARPRKKRAPRTAAISAAVATTEPAKVGIISLGCPKNTVDTEVLLGRIAEKHVVCADPADADIVVVNTCAFIDQARDESMAVIREMAGWKKDGRIQGLVVAGCLAQRWGDKIREEVGEVDSVIAMAEYEEINGVLDKVIKAKDLAEKAQAPWRTLVAEDPSFELSAQTGRLRITPPHYAYLQVSDGCDNACTFCSIPTFRGLFRSKPRAAILAEARELVAAGAVELNLISQDTTDWGKDLPGQGGLARLLRDLVKVEGLRWVRLLYAYPGHVSDDLVATLRDLSTPAKGRATVVPYVDIPIQHISSPVLKRMGRRHTKEQTAALLTKLRAEVPGVVLRTTVICGFPGETEAQHEELIEFIREFRFERLGAFPYSHEPDTSAGERFEDDVPAAVKKRRVEAVMAAQQPIAFAHSKALVGRELEVLVEGHAEDGTLRARTAWEAPEIDPHVVIRKGHAHEGELVRVKVVRASGYDVVAELV